jgi:type IV secretion system protein VirB9
MRSHVCGLWAIGLTWLAILAAAPSACHAAATPRPGPVDPRIKTIDYDPSQVVRIVGAFRTATQIIFAQDEVIAHVALGDSSGWDVVAETNILFAKPKAPRAPTNLIVTTKIGGAVRNYTFELTTRGGPIGRDAPDTFFVVRFRYRDQDREDLVKALSAQAAALEQTLTQWKLDRGVVEGPRNLDYVLRGSTAIAPSEVSDNGRFTALRFPGAQALPAVYVVNPDGAEALAAFDVRGEFIIVHQTAALLRLRRGREVLCVINQHPPAHGVDLGTGTATSQVSRTLKNEARP